MSKFVGESKFAKEALALIDGEHKDDPAIKIAHAPFEAWKESLQNELDKLATNRRFLDCRGREKISVLLTFLNIADWSKSAQDAIDWIDGKTVLAEDHVMNLQRPDAEPIIRDIRRIAESEAKVC